MTPDDEAFERLRAADPAAGTEPDLATIRAAVAAGAGVPLAGLSSGEPPVRGSSGAWHDELAARRRRTEWLRMAAAVAAVAVVGTGGYFLANGGGNAGAAASQALPAIGLDTGGAGREQAATGAGAALAPVAQGASSALGRPAVGMAMPYYGGRIVFTGQGLSADAGSATAWAFDASSVVSAATAERVAGVLGVTGTPRAEWGSWVVGPSDGSGPSVQIDAGGSLQYYDPGRDPSQCLTSSGAGVSGSGSTTGGFIPPAEPVATPSAEPDAATGAPAATAPTGVAPTPLPAPVGSPVPVRPGPANPSVCSGTTATGDAATSRARGALTALGIDTRGAQVQVDDSNDKGAAMGGAAYVTVSFQQVIDGRLTGVSWNVTLVGDGVQGINGMLAPLVSLGTYPVISPAAAADRLNDPRFGASGGVVSYLAAQGAAGSATSSGSTASSGVATANPSQDPTTPPAPKPGAAISWPVQHVTLVSAQLGVALVYQPDGTQVLAPAYSLTDTTGATWSVIAVADDHLNFGSR